MLTSPGFGFSSVNRLRFLLILCHKLLVSCPAWFSRARQNQKRSCPHPRIPPSRTARETGVPSNSVWLLGWGGVGHPLHGSRKHKPKLEKARPPVLSITGVSSESDLAIFRQR